MERQNARWIKNGFGRALASKQIFSKWYHINITKQGGYIDMENKLMNKDDVKKYLGIGRDRVNELFKLKSFPCIRINNSNFALE